jgi:uncharacterized membrane protein (DUF485 family)
MQVGLDTLLTMTVNIEAMLGLLLLFAWVQNTSIHAVAWWGFAYLLRACSISLFGMYGTVSDLITIDLANAILFISFASTWMGARVFGGRSVQPFALVAGAALWLIASRARFLIDSQNISVLLGSGIITAYTWLAAYEFWRGRDDPLISRWPTIFVLAAYGAQILLHTPLSAILPWTTDNHLISSAWLTTISFGTLLFTIAVAFLFLAIAKERNESRQKTITVRLWRWPTYLSRAK